MRKLSVALILGLLTGLAAIGNSTSTAATTCTFTIVNSTMNLDADCTTDATITIPEGFTLDGNGYTITAVDPGAGHFLGAVVANGGTIAHVTDLTITTSALANMCDGPGPPDNRLRGILFDGASGTINHNSVLDINQGLSGCQEGNAIEVRNAPFDGTHPNTQHVTITGNTIIDYQKTGIVANGDVNATIQGNTVSGLGPVFFIAQNSIQVGFGGTGRVIDNTVASNFFTGNDWVSTGILLFQVNGATVKGNAVAASQTGIAIESWCFLGGPPGSNNNHIVRNTIDDADFGVSAISFTFFSECDPEVNNNKVVGNTITNTLGGDTGVAVGAFDLDIPAAGFDPAADNNKIINNAIQGYTTDIDDSGSSSKIHANVTTP